MSTEPSVLRFGGSSGADPAFDPSRSSPSAMFQAFGIWLGAVYAMEHDLPMDSEHLAAFDPTEVMPLYHAEAERARPAIEGGMTIEQAWLMEQLLTRRPSTCVLVDRFVGQPLNRITRLRVATAQALVGELIDRLARGFRFAGRSALVAAVEDAYFEAAEPIGVGVLVGIDGHAVSIVSADPRTGDLTYHDPWPERTLLPGGRPTEEGGLYRIAGKDLTAIVAYALVPDKAPGERSPDIYAATVRQEADPSKGAPLDVAWHANWQVAGPSYCLLVEGVDVGAVERIPYRAELPAAQIVAILAEASRRRERSTCVASVRIAEARGHAITLLRVTEDGVVFHDPWPEGSLLAADRNELAIAAEQVPDGWQITTEELARCLQAVFVAPDVLAEIQGSEHRKTLAAVLAALAFFNIHEVSRTKRDAVWEVDAQPGGFQDDVRITFALDAHEWLEAARLSVRRSWLQSQNQPFAVDIIKSFIAAAVSPLDEQEAGVAVRAIEAITFGQQALVEALSGGAPHLLGQARGFVVAILGTDQQALLTYAFTRVVAVNRGGDDPWLDIGIERASRTAGPLVVGIQLPTPWNEGQL